MKKLFNSVLAFLFISLVYAQEAPDNNARWMQFPSLSHDGQHIAFSYMGNIYKVSVDGGLAIPLTVGEAYNKNPIWSHDDETIAYSSDLYGNFDVFVIPSNGGAALRLTYHSADDYPYDFTIDNKNVLVGSHRDAPAQSVRFPSTRFFQNLYITPIDGSRPKLLTAAGVEYARFDNEGNRIIFQDKKGYEDEYRKHHTSSIARDIWSYDILKNEYTKITSFRGENREPSFSRDGQHIYYTSQKNGDLNIFKKSLQNNTTIQLTHFKDFPVRSLSVSDDNKLAFTWKGDIYTMEEGQAPQKVNIKILNNAGYNAIRNINISKITEFAVNPNGKEIAYINRGEIFVTGIDNNITKRITNTPSQERMITWSADGKTLLYSGEQDGSWNVYQVELKYPEEKFFYAATLFNTATVVATDADEFQAEFSPDGKKVAYIEERNILKVLDINSGEKTTILPEGRNYSYRDGDWNFSWSPDSKWLLVDDGKGYFSATNTALIPVEGDQNTTIYPVNSGFGEYNSKWGLEGKMMTYESSKLGRKSLAYQGNRETDIYAVFFNQEAYDEFLLSKDEYGLLKAQREEESKENKEDDKKEDKKKKSKKTKDSEDETLKLNLENLSEKIVRLTINSASISDYALNKDGSKLFYLAAFEKDYDLWVTEPRTRETKILAKIGGSPSKIVLSDDEKHIFLSNNGQLLKIDASTGKREVISTQAKLELNAEAEREYIYNHIWRQVKKKFYDPEIHGIDWSMYRNAYAEFLPHINNNYDFQILLSELLGELNASHTGGRYFPSSKDGDATASFGVLYDESYQGKGVKISTIIPNGPLDKADNKIKSGDIIVEINGQEINAEDNWNRYFNNIIGENTLLTIQQGSTTFNQTIKPISLRQQNELMYKRWVKTMEDITDSLSNGKLAYVHVRGMNDNSFRDVYENVMGRSIDKKALIVDTRFNGGGWLHNDLNTFLSGEEYLKFAPQGKVTKGGEPLDRWTKPSIVIMSEGNYSDAFIFPYVYKQNKIGKLVGMPVPGTGTAVWWERQIDPTIVFGIPMVATIGEEGRPTENLELQPDILVPLPYSKFLNGIDTQLEKAIEELLKEVE